MLLSATAGKCLIILVYCLQLCSLLAETPLTCPYDQYVVRRDDGNECCPMCPPGYKVKFECTADQSTDCTPCDGGTYMDTYNTKKVCHECLNCTEATGLREISSCTNTQTAVCEPLEGFLCVDGTVDRCVAAQQHSRCEPGQYISRAGTFSTDTECVDCSEGTFSDGTFTSCQDHKQCSRLQQQGNIYSDSVCQEGLTAEVAVIVTGFVVLFLSCVSAVFLIRKHRRMKELRRRIAEDAEDTLSLKTLNNLDNHTEIQIV